MEKIVEYLKNKGGRPKEDLSSLSDGWYNEVLELYSQGAPDVEVKALLANMRGSMSNDLWDRWLTEEDEFSETIRVGKTLSEAWWHKEGRTSMRDKNFSYTGWYMQMKNRFGWSDKTETKIKADVNQITQFEMPDNGRSSE